MNPLVYLKHLIEYSYFSLKPKSYFTYKGKQYPYFYHMYNATWVAERKIEIPIFIDLLNQYKGKKILEVGNVLSHYIKVNHTIVDKYEKAKGVLNIDIIDYNPEERYDLIISISTLEHVGYDEPIRDYYKAVTAVKHLRTLLAPEGKLVFSFPGGYNMSLQNYIIPQVPDGLKLNQIWAEKGGMTGNSKRILNIVETI